MKLTQDEIDFFKRINKYGEMIGYIIKHIGQLSDDDIEKLYYKLGGK